MNDFRYVSIWKRMLSQLIDAFIFLPLLHPFVLFLKWVTQNRLIFPLILFYVAAVLFIAFMTSRFGGTPGKLILKYKICDETGNLLKFHMAVLRQLFIIIFLSLLVVQYIYVFNKVPKDIVLISKQLPQYTGAFASTLNSFKLAYFLSCLFVLFNKQRRAIHDYIAHSYVVKR